MRIEVTAEDIKAGRRGASCHCPIAQSLRRAGFKAPSVQPWNWGDSIDGHGSFGYLDLDGNSQVRLPFEAAEKARDYDEGRGMSPFAFDLDIPTPPASATTTGKETP